MADEALSPQPQSSHLARHDKFYAFMALLVTLLMLAGFGVFAAKTDQGVRLVDIAIGGIIGAIAQAALGIFRHSQVEQDIASTARTQAEKVPPFTGEAKEALETAPNLPGNGASGDVSGNRVPDSQISGTALSGDPTGSGGAADESALPEYARAG